MEIEENLYLKVLVWAYKKRNTGFTHEELNNSIIKNPSERKWVYEMFFTSHNRPLVGFLENRDGKDYFSLTDSGMAAAVDYLELKETQKGSSLALRVAIASIVVSVVVGIFQIVVDIWFK